MEGRERNVDRVSRLSIVLSRFTRYTASSKGYYLREVNLLFISGVLFAYVAGELKAKNDILRSFFHDISYNVKNTLTKTRNYINTRILDTRLSRYREYLN
jgi:hypothetical protein